MRIKRPAVLGIAAAFIALTIGSLALNTASAQEAAPAVKAAPVVQQAVEISPYAIPVDPANAPIPDLDALARESSRDLTTCLKGMTATSPYNLADAQTSSCFGSIATRYRFHYVESTGVRGMTRDFTSNRYEVHFGANTSTLYPNGDIQPLTACTFYYNYEAGTTSMWCDGTLSYTRSL